MFSTIKRKTCKCGCLRLPTLGCAGYSYQCMPEELKAKVGDKKKLQQKRLNASKYASTKLRMDNYKENVEQELWFRMIALEIEKNPRCMECNAWISKPYYKAATAHIFPKGNDYFPSVATNPHNYLILGAGCGCHDKTHRIDTFSKMKCFPIAIERFYLFEKEIKENHKYLTLFKEAIKSYNYEKV